MDFVIALFLEKVTNSTGMQAAVCVYSGSFHQRETTCITMKGDNTVI